MTPPTDLTASAAISDLMTFLDASPSPFHVVETVSHRLANADFVELGSDMASRDLPAAGFVRRNGAVIAFRLGEDSATTAGCTIVGAHTDSPQLRIAPRPDVSRLGWHQLHVEVYGSILNNSWLDRDLGIAGQVVGADGTTALVRSADAVARIPQLAVHLDRTVNDGLALNRQEHLRPVWATGTTGPNFRDWLASETGLTDPIFWNVGLFDTQPADLIGADRSLLSSGRLDNQLSCWAAIAALINSPPAERTAVVALFDHEEVGSGSTTGADGPWLSHFLESLSIARGATRHQHLESLARSVIVSADGAHAVHPNYSDRHDPRHAPQVNNGPVIKINANQRYATSAETAAWFARACTNAGVNYQLFVSNNAIPCGSTIGPLSAAQLGIETVDVGVAQLSMHSAREMCGSADPGELARALGSALHLPLDPARR